MDATMSTETWRELLAQRELFDKVPVGFAVLGPDGRCHGANRTWATLLAVHPRTQVDGRLLGVILPTRVAEQLDVGLRSARRTGGPVHEQCELPLATGPRLLNLTFQAGPDGDVASWVTDATHERDADRHDERFRKLFTELPVGAAIIGHDGRWFQANYELSTTMGLPEEALLGHYGPRLVHPQDAPTLERTLRAARSSGRACCRIRLLRRDGSAPVFDVFVSRVVCGVAGEHYFVAHFRDAPEPVLCAPARMPTVVVVDDEPASATVTGEMLRHEHLNVYVTTSPKAALARIRSDPAAGVLVTDLLMPGMSGEELVRAARAARSDLKVVCISGFTPRLPTSSEPDSNTVWLPKPFGSAQLVQAVRRMLAAGAPAARGEVVYDLGAQA